jgi:hypothetical protein
MRPIRLRTFSRLFLAVLQVFVGLTAIVGGAKLVSDPSGNAVGVPLEWLSGSPFSDYSVPGWVLVVAIGLGHAAASLLSAFGHRQFGRAAIVQGGLLAGYIAVEVWAIGWQAALQPLYFILGLAQIALGFFAQRKREAGCEDVPDLPGAAPGECAGEPYR